MSEELKPCPFCGKSWLAAEKISYSADGFAYRVECECTARGAWAETEEQAIEAWNTRAEHTCHVVVSEFGELDEYPHTWLSCGHHTMLLPREMNYCPECGARVVEVARGR